MGSTVVRITQIALRTCLLCLFVLVAWAPATVAQDASGDAESNTERESGWLSDLKDRLNFSGIADMEWAHEITTGDGQKLELQLHPELQIDLPKDLRLTAIGRMRAELFDELEPGDPGQPTVMGPTRRWNWGDSFDLELRELYLDATLDDTAIGDAYLRLGKQQIVWGRADGLKVLDVVNPQDFREFILDDFEDSRIPLWALNLEIPIGDVNAQLVWIPDTTVHRLAPEGAAYEVTAGLPQAPNFIQVNVAEPNRPNNPIADSDVGLRLSTFWKGWDLTLNYLYRYDDFPALYRTIRLLPFPQIDISPEYERTHLIGGTFSNAFGDLTLRGELGYSVDRVYSSGRLLDRDGVYTADEFSYVLGFDWFGISDTFLSFQLFQNFLVDGPDEGKLRDTVETNLTFTMRRDFRNDTLLLETIWIHNVNDGDGLIRPKISYDLRDNWTLWGGVDYFYGSGNGVFGQFDHRDRVVFGMEWGF